MHFSRFTPFFSLLDLEKTVSYQLIKSYSFSFVATITMYLLVFHIVFFYSPHHISQGKQKSWFLYTLPVSLCSTLPPASLEDLSHIPVHASEASIVIRNRQWWEEEEENEVVVVFFFFLLLLGGALMKPPQKKIKNK